MAQTPSIEFATKKLSELTAYSNNARTHSRAQVAQIVASIKEFGFTNPVLCNPDGVLIAGHGRLMAAKRLKLKTVPAMVITGLTEAQHAALVLADNKLALNAEWDEDMLAEELRRLSDGGYNIALTGFNDDECAQFLKTGTAEAIRDDDAVPEPPTDPISAQGDVWALGAHKVMCGSATELADVKTLAAGEAIDLLLTDPPYNVNYEGKTKAALKIKNDAMGDDAFFGFLLAAFTNADHVMRPGASYYIWHADSEGYNFRRAAIAAGWKLRQCLIWLKDTMVMGRQDYHWKHEPCLYGWKDGAAHTWASDRKQVTVIECKRPTRNAVHPTMKPVELMEYQIGNNTRKNEIVLDLFGGSGSTLIACEKIGRACRAMELDPRYVDVIVRRWQEYTGKEATLLSTGQTFEEVSHGRKK